MSQPSRVRTGRAASRPITAGYASAFSRNDDQAKPGPIQGQHHQNLRPQYLQYPQPRRPLYPPISSQYPSTGPYFAQSHGSNLYGQILPQQEGQQHDPYGYGQVASVQPSHPPAERGIYAGNLGPQGLDEEIASDDEFSGTAHSEDDQPSRATARGKAVPRNRVPKKSTKKSEAQVRRKGRALEYCLDGKWVPAVYHNDIRAKLIAEASRKGQYVHEREHGEHADDVTSYLPAQEQWGPDRNINWTPILYQLKKNDYPIPDYLPALWWDDNRIVLSKYENIPLKRYEVLPDTLSSKIAGRDMEAMKRLDSRISHRDFQARMPPRLVGKKGKAEEPFSISSIGMKMSRFREREGLLAWTDREGTETITKALLEWLPKENVEQNTIFGVRGPTKEEAEGFKKGNKGKFNNRAGQNALPEEERQRREEVARKRLAKKQGRLTSHASHQKPTQSGRRKRNRSEASDDEDEDAVVQGSRRQKLHHPPGPDRSNAESIRSITNSPAPALHTDDGPAEYLEDSLTPVQPTNGEQEAAFEAFLAQPHHPGDTNSPDNYGTFHAPGSIANLNVQGSYRGTEAFNTNAQQNKMAKRKRVTGDANSERDCRRQKLSPASSPTRSALGRSPSGSPSNDEDYSDRLGNDSPTRSQGRSRSRNQTATPINLGNNSNEWRYSANTLDNYDADWTPRRSSGGFPSSDTIYYLGTKHALGREYSAAPVGDQSESFKKYFGLYYDLSSNIGRNWTYQADASDNYLEDCSPGRSPSNANDSGSVYYIGSGGHTSG